MASSLTRDQSHDLQPPPIYYDESTDINLVFSMEIFLCINLIKQDIDFLQIFYVLHFGIEGVVTSWEREREREREYVSLALYY
jgi:hypothetical protein